MTGAAPALRSGLYEGRVVHARTEPAHRFTTSLVLPLLFLDELPRLRSLHPMADLDPDDRRRKGRPAAIRLSRADFLPGPAPTLADAVADTVRRAGHDPAGPVAMLGHLRTWGWLFNPLTVFFCFDPAGTHVRSAVLEVSNTPWHERHRYVVGPPGEHRFAKELHVSPFVPTEGSYTLHYSEPGETLRVDLAVEAAPRALDGALDEAPSPVLRASLRRRRRPLDRAALTRLLVAQPFMTARVSAGIYAQALRLAAKGARVHAHPSRRHVGARNGGRDG